MLAYQKESKHDQELPQSHTADQTTAPYGRVRARIGCFLQLDKRRNAKNTLKKFGRKFSLSLRLALVLGVLTIMAGVEQIPGPQRK